MTPTLIGYKIHNRIPVVNDKNKKRRNLSDINTIMIHGNGVATDAVGVARWYEMEFQKPRATREAHSPDMPYTFTISSAGTIEQALPLTTISPHGRGWNGYSIGIAVLGWPFTGPLPAVQMDALIWLSRWLYQAFAPVPGGHTYGPRFVGHSEAPGASDGRKNCPGKHVKVGEVRDQIQAEIQDDARKVLCGAGMVLGPIGPDDDTSPGIHIS